ncbi:Pyridoxamine 5'-phosphate oxidase, partial [Coniochaeta hoffmannii]
PPPPPPKVAPSGCPTPSALPTSPGPGQAPQFLLSEQRGGLRRSDLDPTSPITQFHAWFSAAAAAAVSHPETCTLSTASLPSGRVSARVVYMKELDTKGFVVYSNFGTSRKGRDLFGDPDGGGESVGNPWASLTFWWEPLERQVRVEGRAERLPKEDSQKYFDTRVRGSRVGAWASRQSSVLQPEGGGDDDGRRMLERWVREAEERFEGTEDIPCPDFWGGLRIVPERVEFWQGRENRLHDRFVYEREGEEWRLERLSP